MIRSIYSISVVAIVIVAILGTSLYTPKPAFSQEENGDDSLCGPMDIAIALDDTGSMGGAISNVILELPTIIGQAQSASGGDLRLGYLTFKDDVTVHHELTTNVADVEASIAGTVASGGDGAPEASDIAKSLAVNNTDDFDEPWRDDDVVKVLILITDAPPGGTDDVTDPEDVARMDSAALAALGKGIKVSDVFVPTSGDYAGQAAILKNDADKSGGVFVTTEANGTGTSSAITKIIEDCGEPPDRFDVVCPPENVQHWDKIVFSIKNSEIAREFNVTARTPLDIKVLDDPNTVADIKLKVLDFLKMPDDEKFRKSITIIDVEYATICAAVPTPSTGEGKTLTSLPLISEELREEVLERAEEVQQEEEEEEDEEEEAPPANVTEDEENEEEEDEEEQ
jgi:hypothetical protein